MREMMSLGTVVSRVCTVLPKLSKITVTASALLFTTLTVTNADPLPGGTLDPLTIKKFVAPLVIPPAMPMKKCKKQDDLKLSADRRQCDVDYEIAVRQFEQQILPAPLPATTVWSYGSVTKPGTVADGGSFNYPALTIEARNNKSTTVRWINDLIDDSGNYLPHLLAGTVDQTLHWANPASENCPDAGTDCAGDTAEPYDGPVPIVTHVHGAHVGPESDGYPEAWWLPDPVKAGYDPEKYKPTGSLYDQSPGYPRQLGQAVFTYPNDQPSSILWYHDHTLGMTRLNVYAGPAGFYILRNKKGKDDGIDDDHKLPGPAPQLGDKPGKKYYDIPIVIQDRSFNEDGSLFYPTERAFFEEDPIDIKFAPDSDIAPIWNPEAFFNTMVVNGNTWPYLKVDQTRYRFRLLNGSNSRFLNLSLRKVRKNGQYGKEIPFWVIGAESGMLPHVVKVKTGKTVKFNDGERIRPQVPVHPDQALLMAPAERFDVIVDFSDFEKGDVIRMINTAPDAPFGGFPDVPADPETTGQVMEFHVGKKDGKEFTDPKEYEMKGQPPLPPAINERNPRLLSLNEEESIEVCVLQDENGVLVQQPDFDACIAAGGEAFAPKAALLGLTEFVNGDKNDPRGIPQLWSEDITQNPGLGATEVWELYNFTEDAHPIHLHLVTFEVESRRVIPAPAFTANRAVVEPWEAGRKDTVIAYPGEITRIKANFDIEGLYVWHCHIVEHEDNEMMLPFYVGDPANSPLPIVPGS